MVAWNRRRSNRDDQVSSLLTEVERLRQDNIRLRMERQRPTNVAAVVEELRSRTRVIGEESADDAHHELAQVGSTRRALVDALDGLIAAASQIRFQVVTNASAMEIDRRSGERRRSSDSQPAEVSRIRSGPRVNAAEHRMPLPQRLERL